MLDSQALSTAIGFSLLFFVLATAASAIVEALSRVLKKRSKDLEATVSAMLAGTTVAPSDGALKVFKGTAVYAAAAAATLQTPYVAKYLARHHPDGRLARLMPPEARPTYLSARAFADAVTEMLAVGQAMDGAPWAGLQRRMTALNAEAGADLLDVKAGLESWFDETMSRLADAYKRWATAVLFVVGLVIAGAGNVSAIDVARTLWLQPVLRQAAVEAAQQSVAKGAPFEVTSVTGLDELGLPVGWPGLTGWGDLSSWLSHVGGWVLTALLVMLGAPFWFDALSRLVSLRTAGAKPPPATQDGASSTSMRASSIAPMPDNSVILDAIHAMPPPPRQAAEHQA